VDYVQVLVNSDSKILAKAQEMIRAMKEDS
jgi:hypothetical protein